MPESTIDGQLFYEQIFAQSGASYHKAMELYPNARDEEFRAAVSQLEIKTHDVILDVPAGGGYLEAYLPSDTNYLAYDFSAGFGHGGVVNKCTEGSIAVDSKSVDHLICLAAMHHIEDRGAFYAEAKRVLKNDGTLLIGDVVVDMPQAGFLNGFVDQWNELGHNGDFINFDRERKALFDAGFDCELSVTKYSWNFLSSDQAAEYCRLLFSLNEHLSSKRIKAQIETLGTKKTSSHFSMNWQLGFIKARPN